MISVAALSNQSFQGRVHVVGVIADPTTRTYPVQILVPNPNHILRPGMMADVTIFDPASIRDVSDFGDPKHYSVGVRHVLVNGRRVVSDGVITSERPGRPLHGPGTK